MKTSIFTSLIIFFCLQITIAQDRVVVDSLHQVLSNHPNRDSIRVDILTELHEELMFSQPLLAKKYAQEELSISKEIDYKMGIGKGYMHLADFFVNRNSTDSALYYYNNAKQLFTSINKARGLIFVNYSIADIERSNGNFDKAIDILQQNLVLIAENETHPDFVAKLNAAQHNTLATVYMDKGDYKIAVIEALKALDLFTRINNEVRKADALKLLGDLEYALENYEKSIEYFKEAIATYQTNNDDFYLAYANGAIGLAFKELDQLQEAKKYQLEAIKLARKNDANLSLSESLNNLGELLILEGNIKEAKANFMEARSIAINEDLKLPLIDANLGLSMATIKNPVESIGYATAGLEMAKDIGAMKSVQRALSIRSNIYEELGRLNLAIKDQKGAQHINDSLFTLKKAQQIEELKTIHETEKKEAEIALQQEEIKTLNEKAKVDKLTKGLYAGGMASALALFGLSVFGYRQRIKKNRIARKKQEEIYKQEIAHKKKELASQTLHLVQKNTFLEELKENLENLKNSPDKFKMEFRRIAMLLKKEKASDRDWETFKTYFSEVHNDFDQKLKTLSSDITEKEIRLAAFLRMNLTTKEIAATMNVLPDSILKSKYRLKKKLGLDKNTDLVEFLSSI
ncbi:tetratricopeptide repeat protein [Maribacter algicola]|uniref:Tetratricopeptide repeat protein n=1 Tax=Meishania litoralis TaxID=3434685 RepID=A0ACC7LL17_9FLAO